jgi:hypothetical protein
MCFTKTLDENEPDLIELKKLTSYLNRQMMQISN